MPQFRYLGNWPGASSRATVRVTTDGTSLRITEKRWLPTAGWSVTIPLASVSALDIVTGAQVTQGQRTEFYDFMAVWQVNGYYLLVTSTAGGVHRQVALRGRLADLETLYRQLLERGRHRVVDDLSSLGDTADTAPT